MAVLLEAADRRKILSVLFSTHIRPICRVRFDLRSYDHDGTSCRTRIDARCAV